MPAFLTIDGPRFRDEHRREVTIRGINVAADAKLPAFPLLTSHDRARFFDGDSVSFVGRPFPPDEADTHLVRLRNYGYNTLRYIFTWEAIEARGPGVYDEDWIASTVAVLRKAKSHGFMVFMDPHQDVWSRFSGGSGAPMWTLYAMGLDPEAFAVTEAALVHNTYPEPGAFPKMIWSTNYQRFACQVAFTLFFAGRDFAPKCVLDGVNIQDYLQRHYIAACAHLARRIHEAGDLEDCPVIGWESMNEPNRGIIGYQNLAGIPDEQKLQKGTSPTAWQAILTANGRACEISTWDFGGTGPYRTGKALVDPAGVTAWLPADYDDSRYGWRRAASWPLGECIWALHGVWDTATDTLLRPDYFAQSPSMGAKLNPEQFTNLYFMPHYRDYSDAIRAIHRSAIIFCQPPVLELPPSIKGTPDAHDRMVYAPHYYDGITLMTKKWNRLWNIDVLGVLRGRYLTPAFAIRFGETAIRNCLKDQLIAMKQEGVDYIGVTPCVFTEIGIPYDMDDRYAYRTGNFISQIRALDANHYALEGASVGYSLWTYTTTVSPDFSRSLITLRLPSQNDHQWGDQWNGEDLSIYSLSDILPYHSAARPSTSSPSATPITSSTTLKRALNHSRMSSASSPSSSPSTIPTPTRAAEAFVRPSPIATSGDVLSWGFDLVNVEFTMKLLAAQPTDEMYPTEIFLPPMHFPKLQTGVLVSGGKWEYAKDEGEEGQGRTERATLRWWHMEGEQEIKIKGVKVHSALNGADEEVGYLDTYWRSCDVM